MCLVSRKDTGTIFQNPPKSCQAHLQQIHQLPCDARTAQILIRIRAARLFRIDNRIRLRKVVFFLPVLANGIVRFMMIGDDDGHSQLLRPQYLIDLRNAIVTGNNKIDPV